MINLIHHYSKKSCEECKEKFHEMREKISDETPEHLHEFLCHKAKQFKHGY